MKWQYEQYESDGSYDEAIDGMEKEQSKDTHDQGEWVKIPLLPNEVGKGAGQGSRHNCITIS